jgi:tRNA(fMet)-specific endonuclease VapC
MTYLFDTNIVVHYLRESSLYQFIENQFFPFIDGNETALCVVSIGELRSIAIQSQWGLKRLTKFEEYLSEFIITDIRSEDVLLRYAEIDAFSQGRLNDNPLVLTARNMGKNDLWIAATASVLSATLITTDNDFEHLDQIYLNLIKLDPKI